MNLPTRGTSFKLVAKPESALLQFSNKARKIRDGQHHSIPAARHLRLPVPTVIGTDRYLVGGAAPCCVAPPWPFSDSELRGGATRKAPTAAYVVRPRVIVVPRVLVMPT